MNKKTSLQKFSFYILIVTLPLFVFTVLFFTRQTNAGYSISSVKHVNPFQDRFIKQVDTLINNTFTRQNTPGAAVVIVKDTTIIYMHGLGLKDNVNTKTIFRLGSVSKGITAMLSSLLVADSLFGWDDTLSTYIPDFKISPKSESDSITIRHILSHSSGLPYHTYTNLIEDGKSLDEILPYLKNVHLIARPGERYSYQNVIFSLIANVIKKQAGKDFSTVLTERLFIPLGMNRASATYEAITADSNVALPHRQIDSIWTATTISKKYYNAAPAGGINASISDMSHYLRALLGGYPKIINEDQLNQLFKPRVNTAIEWRYRRIWKGLKDMHYALGWRTMEFEKDTLIYHGGYVNSYRSAVAFDKKNKWGICVLSNAPSGFVPKVMSGFWDLYQTHSRSIDSWDDYIRKMISSENNVLMKD
ncbi:MAG: beta-lactamase family protein [Calditrichaeota bacterium]|nr:beta-lactamase family protein [Calditrichota bacterium]